MSALLQIAVMAIPRIGQRQKLHIYLDEHMKARGVSDARLAGRLETDRTTVWRWRKGKRRIKPEEAARIAFALDCEVSDLYSLPARPSIDARLKNVSDDDYKAILDFVVKMTARK